MTNYKMKSKIFAIILILIFTAVSCKEEAPPIVYDPDDTGEAVPKINSIEPNDFALAGITQVKISGENFSTQTDTVYGNKVYFNNLPAKIVSVSATELIVIPPEIEGDSITIKIVKPLALGVAEYYPYKVQSVVNKMTQFLPKEIITAIDLDAEENLFAFVQDTANRGKIYRISSDGNKTTYGSTAFPFASDIKIGPNGYLYLQQVNSRNVFRINPGGGAAEVYVNLPEGMWFFDFDQNKNLYTAGLSKDMYVINTAGVSKKVGNFKQYDVKSLRVYNNYVYILANYKGPDAAIPDLGIWKSKILNADGDLDVIELITEVTQRFIF